MVFLKIQQTPSLLLMQHNTRYFHLNFNRYGKYLNLDEMSLIWGFTVAIFAVGGMIGSFLMGGIAKRLGLLKSFWYNNILAIVGALLMGLSKFGRSFEMLILGEW